MCVCMSALCSVLFVSGGIGKVVTGVWVYIFLCSVFTAVGMGACMLTYTDVLPRTAGRGMKLPVGQRDRR